MQIQKNEHCKMYAKTQSDQQVSQITIKWLGMT